MPFVLHSQPTGVFEHRDGNVAQMAERTHNRYAEIMKDVEDMIDDHSKLFVLMPQNPSTPSSFPQYSCVSSNSIGRHIFCLDIAIQILT